MPGLPSGAVIVWGKPGAESVQQLQQRPFHPKWAEGVGGGGEFGAGESLGRGRVWGGGEFGAGESLGRENKPKGASFYIFFITFLHVQCIHEKER